MGVCPCRNAPRPASIYERLNSDPGNFAIGNDVIYDGEAEAWGVPAHTTIDIAGDDEPSDEEQAELDAPLPLDLARELGLDR